MSIRSMIGIAGSSVHLCSLFKEHGKFVVDKLLCSFCGTFGLRETIEFLERWRDRVSKFGRWLGLMHPCGHCQLGLF